MHKQFMSPLSICLLLALVFCVRAADDLTPLICLDEADALALVNAARPNDALMNYIYGDLTDAAFNAILQSYHLIRVIDDDSGILDSRRYCYPPAWRPSTEPIIAFNTTGGINCTGLSVNDTTPPPMQVFVLFQILACYEHLIVNSLCSDYNAVAILVGYSSTTGAPIYVQGCAPGHVCTDNSPDHALFVSTTVGLLVVFLALVIAAFVAVRMAKKHLAGSTTKEYALLPAGTGV